MTSSSGSDSSHGYRAQRQSVKRLRRSKNTSTSRKKSSSSRVPRCETPVSTADSESYFSSDWSVTDDLEEDDDDLDLDLDLDVTGTYVPPYISDPEPFAVPKSFALAQGSHLLGKEALPVSCGRSYSSVEGFDWMEDYMTPEVVDLMADDWLVAADNICLRDVIVM